MISECVLQTSQDTDNENDKNHAIHFEQHNG